MFLSSPAKSNQWNPLLEGQQRQAALASINGIGLSLLAMITNIEPRWDRIFMADIPPACHP